MKLYQINFKEGYKDIVLKNYDKDIQYIEILINDYSIKAQWPKIEIQIESKGKKSDIPYFWSTMGAVVISQKAKDELRDFWNNDKFELLPLYLEDETYYIVHVIKLEDLEYDMEEDKEGNLIDVFNKQELISKNIVDKGIFRMRLKNGEPDDIVFITEKFVQMVKNSTLKGVNFEIVWDSETKGEV